MSRVSYPSNENSEKKFFEKFQKICGKVIFGVPEIGGFGGVDDL